MVEAIDTRHTRIRSMLWKDPTSSLLIFIQLFSFSKSFSTLVSFVEYALSIIRMRVTTMKMIIRRFDGYKTVHERNYKTRTEKQKKN